MPTSFSAPTITTKRRALAATTFSRVSAPPLRGGAPPAVALDEIELRIDLVRPVDADVDEARLGERHERDAELLRQRRRAIGGGHCAASPEAARDALSERAHEGGGG